MALQSGAVSESHVHEVSEQVWLVEEGTATMLLDDNEVRVISAGQLVRTRCWCISCIENTGPGVFGYWSITTPPEDFTKF
ncbi:cupin domain-containing protein [Rhodococcoides fascians A25f]|nr:cupin domain-containing protein [Rhodococcus fascians A25f]